MFTQKDKERINLITEEFKKNFNEKPLKYFKSTGRLEIIGNHVDHNSGICMVSSVDNLNIYAAVGLRDDNKVVVISSGFKAMEVSLNDLEMKEEEKESSISFVRGILFKFKELGYKISGFSAIFDSNIYKGAGVSSSAAYAVMICKILANLFNNDNIDTVTIAKTSRFAENKYFGKSSGLLDQIGCCSKGFSMVDFADQENPVIELVSPDFTDYSLLLINTMTDHSGVSDMYSSIPADMKSIAKLFNVKYLREVKYEDFLKEYNKYNHSEELAWNRAYHYFNENIRVEKAFKAVKENNIKEFLHMVNESGLSSELILKNVLLPNEETNNYLVALHLAREFLKDEGAVRVHGGGFGGTILCFVKKDQKDAFIEHMSKKFDKENIKEVYTCLDPLRVIDSSEF